MVQMKNKMPFSLTACFAKLGSTMDDGADWESLSSCVLLHILSFLDAESLRICIFVCKQWSNVATDNNLWLSLTARNWYYDP